jgi:hypothetical protein
MNFGVIEGRRGDDYLGGTLPFEVRNPLGDWTPYLPPGEFQATNAVDTMACVTFSALNSIETQYRFLTGETRNFSDRFTAQMSGTTAYGNWLWKVGDSIRRDGLVDESIWPTPSSFTFAEYYAIPPIAVVDIGRLFLAQWTIQYEWIDVTRDSLIHHLQHAPIQATIPGHAILDFYTTADVQRYFDSYQPFIRERTEPFVSAMKIVLSRKTMTESEVKKQYKLAFYRLPDATELAFWTGKPLEQFLDTAIADRAAFLAQPI